VTMLARKKDFPTCGLRGLARLRGITGELLGGVKRVRGQGCSACCQDQYDGSAPRHKTPRVT